MPRRPREKSQSGVYHIMWRGVNRQEIFHDDGDRKKYMYILEKYKTQSQMKMYAWCLMNNHVHLLIKEGHEDISSTMKRIGVSYAMYYNWKYQTTGHLFQGRFRSEKVETLPYLQTVIRYIHQNPVKAGMASSPENWKWSSYTEYYKKTPKLLDGNKILAFFSPDIQIAREKFRSYNEEPNDDKCLDEDVGQKRLTDDEARKKLRKILPAGLEITHVKSLPRKERNQILKKIKTLKGISQRQAARILGISPNLIFKA